MNTQREVLAQHALVVVDGRIAGCMPWEEARQAHPSLTVVDKRKGVLLPGLINAHTHLAMNLLRGYADDLPLQPWLENHIWPAEAQHMGTDFVHDGTQLALAESVLSGVTTVNDMYFFPDVTARACSDAGMRAVVGLPVLEFPTAWASDADQYFSRGLTVLDSLRDHPLVSTALAPHSPYTVSTESLERIATLSNELDVSVHMHVHETAQEVEQYASEHGMRPIARLQEIGLLNPQMMAVHLTQLDDEEIEQLAENGVNAIHCPESNLKLASGFCPVAKLVDAGINVAVGTDGAASNNDLDLLGELRTAAFMAKAVSGNAATLPAMQALSMVTINAAQALGLADETGSLEAGKAADCIVIEPDLGMLPIYDPVAQVLYSNSTHCISDVWVAGKQLLKNRTLLTLSDTEIRAKAQHWGNIISSQA